MTAFLNAPYPLRKSTAQEWAFIIGSGVFVALFLIVFQPFGTREFQNEHKYLFLAGYGAVISTSIFLVVRVMPLFVPKWFKEEHWTVGKHILFFLLAFSLVFFACYVYRDLFFGNPISWRGFLGFYPIAISVAVFPIAGLVIADYVLQLRRFTAGAASANVHFSKNDKPAAPNRVALPDENGKTALETSVADILYIQADDNYVEVHHLEGEKPARTIIRNSLTALEALLEPVGFTRCHRSFLVNLSLVEKVSGNAQGYQLHFPQSSQTVPVARGRSSEILRKLR